MTNIISIDEYRRSVAAKPKSVRKRRVLYFDRQELSLLMGFYSTQVAHGDWRDYAIDTTVGQAIFSVFKHAHESPLFTITKQIPPGGGDIEWILHDGTKRLKRSANVNDAIQALLAVVKG